MAWTKGPHSTEIVTADSLNAYLRDNYYDHIGPGRYVDIAQEPDVDCAVVEIPTIVVAATAGAALAQTKVSRRQLLGLWWKRYKRDR